MARPFPSTHPWIDPDGALTLGKYKGDLVEDVAIKDPGYLRWVLEEADTLNDEDRKIIEAHLDNRGRR